MDEEVRSDFVVDADEYDDEDEDQSSPIFNLSEENLSSIDSAKRVAFIK